MNSRPKKHHNVPCLVLRYFIGTDPVGRVWTYDKQDAVGDSPRNSLPEETAVQTNLHTVFDKDGEPNVAIEHWLAEVESKASKIYAGLHEGKIPNSADRIYFSQFMATLYCRSPGLRRVYGEILGSGVDAKLNMFAASKERFEKNYKQYQKEIGDQGVADLDALYEFITDKTKYKIQVELQVTIQALEISNTLLKIFNDMSWVVLSTQIERPFIIGDFPVVLAVRLNTHYPIFGDGGFMNKTAVVSLPLSPTKLLRLTWSDGGARNIVPADRELVKTFNRTSAYFAERYLYADRRDEGLRRLAIKNKDNRFEMSISSTNELADVEVKRKLK